MFESDIACEVLDDQTQGTSLLKKRSLEYLAVTNNLNLGSKHVGGLSHILSGCPQPRKYMLSLQPKIVRKPAVQLREEMMSRYEGQNYYFLEEHIGGMMVIGHFQVTED
jgi:hypothetical protein